ncbi:hypothetical protein C0J52_26822, partial [Blattella germanica]
INILKLIGSCCLGGGSGIELITDPGRSSIQDCKKYEFGHVVNDEPNHKIYNFAYETVQNIDDDDDDDDDDKVKFWWIEVLIIALFKSFVIDLSFLVKPCVHIHFLPNRICVNDCCFILQNHQESGLDRTSSERLFGNLNEEGIRRTRFTAKLLINICVNDCCFILQNHQESGLDRTSSERLFGNLNEEGIRRTRFTAKLLINVCSAIM